jgi:hypothetical protein
MLLRALRNENLENKKKHKKPKFFLKKPWFLPALIANCLRADCTNAG